MPKGKRKQLQPPGESTLREKRPRQHAGYYASLLSGKSSEKLYKQKHTSTNHHDHTAKSRQAGRDQPSTSPLPKGKTEIFTPIVEGCIAPRTCLSCPHEDPPRQGKSGSKGQAIAEAGFQVQTFAAEQVQREEMTPKVTAVVRDDFEVSPSSVVRAQGLPGNQASSPAQVSEENGQVTITGSMVQVLQVLQTLTQMKNKKDMAVHAEDLSHSREAIVEKDPDHKTIYLNHTGTGQAVFIHMPPSQHTPDVSTHAAATQFPQNLSPVEPEKNRETLNSPPKVVISCASECLGRSDQSETHVIHEEMNGCTNFHTKASTKESRSTIKNNRAKSVTQSNPYVLVDSTEEEDRSTIKTRSLKSVAYLNPNVIIESEWTVTNSDTETLHETSATTIPSDSSQTADTRREDSSQERQQTTMLLEASSRCGMCNAPCGDDEETKKHMETAHGSKDRPFTCGVCSLVFPYKKCLLTHLKGQHWAPNQTCQICGKRFQVQRYLLTHLMRHAGVKKFQCGVCGWRFFERHKLKFHLELHKAESERQLPYTCQLCGKKFANRASWSDHCNTHSGDRPFVCEICGACFSHRVGLRRHKVTHDKVKPFACRLCTRTFAVKPKLDQHMITHTGVSKHTCVHCSKVFTTSSSAKRHTTICPESGTAPKREKRRANKPAHTSTTITTTPTTPPSPDATEEIPVSEDVVYMCGDCQACFSTYADAEQHTMIHRDQGSELRQAFTEGEMENSSEVVSKEAATTSTHVSFSESVSNPSSDDKTSLFSDISKTSGEDLFQRTQSVDVLDALNQGIVESSISSSSGMAPKQTVFCGENESAGAVSKPVKVETSSSETDSKQTLEDGAMLDSLYTVTVIHQGTYSEKSVEFPTQQAEENSWIKVEPHPEETSSENHTYDDQVNNLRSADLKTENGEVGDGGGGTHLSEGERMNLAEMEEQTQLAANTLACLSSMGEKL